MQINADAALTVIPRFTRVTPTFNQQYRSSCARTHPHIRPIAHMLNTTTIHNPPGRLSPCPGTRRVIPASLPPTPQW
eukprot:7817426-Pyramimonas_sp.AAC.4